MSAAAYPSVDYGHTSYASAFGRGDVYGLGPDPARAAKRPLTVGIVGCGGVAQAKWLPALRRLQSIGEPVALAGVADPDPDRRLAVARLWGAAPHADAEALLAAGPLDCLLVLAADPAHGPAARAAIAAGVPCLVEKPLVRDAAEALDLCRAAEAAGVLFASVANKRFSPPYDLARRLIDTGALHGAPRLFNGKFTLGYPYVDLLEGGTVHLFDLARFLMGPVARLHARAYGGGGERVDSAVISLAFTSGAVGTLVTSAAALSFKPWERVEIIGSSAVLDIEDQFELRLHDEEVGPSKVWRPAIPNTLLFDESFGGYSGLLDNVFDAVRGLVPLACPARDGAAAVALIEATRLSLRRGTDIDLTEEGLAT